jgi:hypothetical protein
MNDDHKVLVVFVLLVLSFGWLMFDEYLAMVIEVFKWSISDE